MTDDDKDIYDAQVEAQQDLGALAAEWLDAVEQEQAAREANSAAYAAHQAAMTRQQALHESLYSQMPAGSALRFGANVLYPDSKGFIGVRKLI